MKVLLVNHSDTRGGASVVSRRLLEAFVAQGVDASMLVVHKGGDSAKVIKAAAGWRSRLPFIREHARIFCANGFSRDTLFKISIATDGLPLSTHPAVAQADVIILNWVNQGMLSLEEIGLMARVGKKIIWTMHDMWCATGICHHAGTCRAYAQPEGCRNCPLLGKRAGEDDISARTFRRKRALYQRAGIQFVAVSRWLAERCAESELLRGMDICVIPNAFPVHEFQPHPTVGRHELGLPTRGKIVLMGAARLDDPIKGLPLAIEALNKVESDEICPVFFGAIKNPDSFRQLVRPYVHLGTVSDGRRLAQIYAHAHTVISTSYYETLPGTLVEAQGGGAWPVAFDAGGQSDIITNADEGSLVAPYDTDAFALAIDASAARQHSREQLHEATLRFAPEKIAAQYLTLLNK